MKKGLIFISLISLLSFILVVFQGCKKDNEDPNCSITSPISAQQITKGEIVTILAVASDPNGTISEVQFYIDDIKVGTVVNSPYNFEWNTSNASIGNHIIKATCFDNDNASASDQIDVTIVDSTNQLPICSITSPLPSQQITTGETITISAVATDTDGTISEVQFFVDDIKVGTVTSSPYNYEWNTSGESLGNHILKATCFDNNNISASDQIEVGIIEEPITMTDTRDGQKYTIVEIGNQTWFAKNLNYETGDSWWYDDSESNGEVYGRLYTWDSAQIACPEGWRLPSDDDWKVLEMQLGMSESEANSDELWRGTNEGDKMKSTSGWNNNGNGTNSSGFNGLPGGFYATNYASIGDVAGFWTSSEKSNTSAWERGLDSNNSKVFRFDPPKSSRFSVRCIKN